MTPIQAGSRQLQATGLLSSRLLQKLAKKSQASSLMNKGFTLVELMVVIVIVTGFWGRCLGSIDVVV